MIPHCIVYRLQVVACTIPLSWFHPQTGFWDGWLVTGIQDAKVRLMVLFLHGAFGFQQNAVSRDDLTGMLEMYCAHAPYMARQSHL